MAYGYRIYTFDICQGMGQQAMDLADPNAPMEQALMQTLNSLEARGLLLGTPDGRNPRNLAYSTSPRAEAARLLRVDHRSGHIGMHWVAGRRGDSDWLIETNDDISDKASGHELRLDLLMPKSGSRGVIVAEVRGRSYHLPPAARWVANETVAGPSGGPLSWLRLRANQVVDSAYLATLMAKAQSCEVEFEESGVVSSGKARVRKFTMKGFDAATLAALAAQASNWGPGSSVQAKTSELTKALGINTKKLDKANVVLSAPILRIQPETGPRVTLAPDNVQELFTYPLTDTLRPSFADWDKALNKARSLAATKHVAIDLI